MSPQLSPTSSGNAFDPRVPDEKNKTRQDLLTSELAKKLAHETFFVIHEEMKESTFELDKANNISRISWRGEVNVTTASTLLRLGGDSVEYDGYTKLLIDRSELTEFDTEARIWIKDLLRTRAKRLASKVKKLAVINAESKGGNIFGNVLTSAISMIMPGLKLKKFDSLEEGVDWLLH